MTNRNNNEGGSSNMMYALIAGVAVGAAIGIILAPEKGSATRNQINDAVRNVTGKLRNVSQEGFTAINRLKESIYSNSKTYADDLSETGSDSKQHM